MSLGELKALIETSYGWALGVDYEDRRQRHLFWYRSAEKDEPRLGERFNEPGAERELPLGIGADGSIAPSRTGSPAGGELRRSVGEFLLEQPRWRGILRRIQSLAPLPYAEIRDNLLGEACLPVDLLRCKLAIFGAAQVRSEIRPLDPHHPLPGRPGHRGARRSAGRRLGFSEFPVKRVDDGLRIFFPLAPRQGGEGRGEGVAATDSLNDPQHLSLERTRSPWPSPPFRGRGD